VFNSFIDDSGVQDRRVCGLGGLVGSVAQIDRLDEKWRNILSTFEVPEDKGFHANQFFHHVGCFQDWNIGRWRAFLNQLLDAIYRSRVCIVSAMVDVGCFMALNEDERRWMTGGFRGRRWPSEGSPNNPYFAAFVIAIAGAAIHIPEGEKVAFTFDRQNQYEAKAKMNYKDMLVHSSSAVLPKLSEDIVFSSRLSAVVLQAADLIAYQCYQHIIRRTENAGKIVPANYVLKNLRRSKNTLKFLDERSIRTVLENFHAQTVNGLRVKRRKNTQFRVSGTGED
jgi:hypothetical protein